MIVKTNIDVFTAPMWVFDIFNGYKHPEKNSVIKPIIDPEGDPVIGINVLSDPDWAFIGTIKTPDGNEENIVYLLTLKKYSYEE